MDRYLYERISLKTVQPSPYEYVSNFGGTPKADSNYDDNVIWKVYPSPGGGLCLWNEAKYLAIDGSGAIKLIDDCNGGSS